MRCVFDVNDYFAASLSRDGIPAQLIRRWLDGAFEVVVSPMLLTELWRVLANLKIRQRVSEGEAARVLALVRQHAAHHEDLVATVQPIVEDPEDAYLVALAREARAVLVTGDRHLLALADTLPVQSPATVHAWLVRRGEG